MSTCGVGPKEQTSYWRVASCPTSGWPRMSWVGPCFIAPPRFSLGGCGPGVSWAGGPPRSGRSLGMLHVRANIAQADHVVRAAGELGEGACRPMSFKNSEAGHKGLGAWLRGVAEEKASAVVGAEALAAAGWPATRSWRPRVTPPQRPARREPGPCATQGLVQDQERPRRQRAHHGDNEDRPVRPDKASDGRRAGA